MNFETVTVAVPAPIATSFSRISQTPAIKIRHIAEIIGLHPKTLRRAIAAGELTAFRLGGRNGKGDWCVAPADAADYLMRVMQLPPLPPLDLSVNPRAGQKAK